MNGAHLHLVLNHLPVIVTPVGLAVLALGLFRRNGEFAKVGLGLVVAAALLAAPAFFTGEPAEGVAKDLLGVSKEAIERHEEAATGAFVMVALAGLAAAASLVMAVRRGPVPKWLGFTTAALALAASAWLGMTANLGGQVRHSEIRAPEVAGP